MALDELQSKDGSASSGEISSPSSEASGAAVRPKLTPRLVTVTTKPLSATFMKSLSGLCCVDCGKDKVLSTIEYNEKYMPSELYNLQALKQSSSNISPLVLAPMMHSGGNPTVTESIIGEYIAACRMYGCADRINAGVLTTFRFSLPSLRVSGSFHDADMLALTEVLLRHANGALNFIQRLDFTIASKEGRWNNNFGFTSHGAFALSKTLQVTRHVREVLLPRHRIGPYGASAIFMACANNSSIQTLGLRRCGIRERGALAFAELICTSTKTGLVDVDLSANTIGNRGTVAIERGLERRQQTPIEMSVDLEGNLVFPEIMNGCTHGLGIVLSLVGSALLSKRIEGQSRRHDISCAIYSTSLLVLYVSSTLYHSFFALQATKYVFEVMDKCAIYILIAGSYTPFCQILLGDEPKYAVLLQALLWILCFLGIFVEAFFPTWQHRGRFSLMMYMGMGWGAVVCVPEASKRIPQGCVNLIILGGVGYTAGVPFFVRNNNLDHAIWHMFVLTGSICHWLAIYIYVAPQPLPITQFA
jgi:hemolysin III